MGKLLRDRQFRRTVVATLFAAAFVWVAVRGFNVDTNVVYVFAVLAFALVAVLIAAGFLFSFLLHWYMRRKSGMLGDLDKLEEDEARRHESETQDP